MDSNHNLEHTELVRSILGASGNPDWPRSGRTRWASTTGPSAPTDSDSAALISWGTRSRSTLGPGIFLGIEVKTGAGRLSKAQYAWHKQPPQHSVSYSSREASKRLWKGSNNEFGRRFISHAGAVSRRRPRARRAGHRLEIARSDASPYEQRYSSRPHFANPDSTPRRSADGRDRCAYQLRDAPRACSWTCDAAPKSLSSESGTRSPTAPRTRSRSTPQIVLLSGGIRLDSGACERSAKYSRCSNDHRRNAPVGRNAARGGAGPFRIRSSREIRPRRRRRVGLAERGRASAISPRGKVKYLYVRAAAFRSNPLRGSEIDTSWLDFANQFLDCSRADTKDAGGAWSALNFATASSVRTI